ncbi:hypothetical protein GCM10010488_09840 [Oerskovia jenensis]
MADPQRKSVGKTRRAGGCAADGAGSASCRVATVLTVFLRSVVGGWSDSGVEALSRIDSISVPTRPGDVEGER